MSTILQPARWDKNNSSVSSDDDADDDDDNENLSRLSSPSSSPSDNISGSLPPRMRLKDKKRPFEFRVIKQASATPSNSTSGGSAEKELVPIPSPPWAKSKPLPPVNRPQPSGSQSGNVSSSSGHYYPNANSSQHYKPQSSAVLPPKSASTSPYSGSHYAAAHSSRHSWTSSRLVRSFASAPQATSPSTRPPPVPSRSPERLQNDYRYYDDEGESEIDKESDDDDGESLRGRHYRRAGHRPKQYSSGPSVLRTADSPPPSPSPRSHPASPTSYRRTPPSRYHQFSHPVPRAGSPSSSRPFHPYYRSHSYEYPPHQQPPASPMRHRSYHTLPTRLPPSPKIGQQRRYASEDEDNSDEARGRKMDVDKDGKESEMDVDQRKREETEREKEKASRTLPPLPPHRPTDLRAHRAMTYSGGYNGNQYSLPPPRDSHTRGAASSSSRPPEGHPPYPPSHYPHWSPSRYHPPPPPGPHPYTHPPSSSYHGGPPPPPQASYPPPPPAYPPPPAGQPPYGHPPYPVRTHPPGVYPPPPPGPYGHTHPAGPPPPPSHDTSHPARRTSHSYYPPSHQQPPPPSPTAPPNQTQAYHNQQQAQHQQNQTLYQQAQAVRHAAYTSTGSVVPSSGTLTTHPVPYSIGVKAASATAGMSGDAGRLVGEYEQHPLRQQTSYLPISAVGGAQFVLKPPRVPKPKLVKPKPIAPAPPPPPPLPSSSKKIASANENASSSATTNGDVTAANGSGSVEVSHDPTTNGADAGAGSGGSGVAVVVEAVNPEEVPIRIKQEDEGVANVTGVAESAPSADLNPPEVSEINADSNNTAESTNSGGGESNAIDLGGSTTVISLGSPSELLGSETNTFAAPARPSRKVKKYPCDVCGQIFTRSGDVKRHGESRHRDGSGGCRCPYCGRVLTRQDALQRHWDKYCRKKAKRFEKRRRLGPGAYNSAIDSRPVLLDPAPGLSQLEEEEDEAALGGSSGIDFKSFRTIISADRSRFMMYGRKRDKGKQKAKTSRVDKDGDVNMWDESESEIDELESEDPLDGYDTEDEGATEEARKALDEEEIDELDNSDDERSDAEGVSVNGDEFESMSPSSSEGEEEDEDEERDEMEMEMVPDLEPITNGNVDRPAPAVPMVAAVPKPRPEPSNQASVPTAAPKSSSKMANPSVSGPSSNGNHATHVPNTNSSKESPPVSENRRPPRRTAPPPKTPPPPPAPMSAYTSTFSALPPHSRNRGRTEYRGRPDPPPPMGGPGGPGGHPVPPVQGPPAPPPPALSVHVHVPPFAPAPTSGANKSRRGPKPRRNDYDAILDPSQTAAQGGQIRMRVLPQATYIPPVQPALAIMHEQPHVIKKKGKRSDGLVPEYGFVPREYVYRERD